MKVLVTGANGFVGKNLISTLLEMKDVEVFAYDITNTIDELDIYTKECDFVFHLAGVNRPTNPQEFYEGNATFTDILCGKLREHHNQSTIVITSSIQAALDNDYGKSKLDGEQLLRKHGKENNSNVIIYRLKNLFGKWSRPNYNTVVATWCYNVANDIALQINNPQAEVDLCYIDDVVNEFIEALKNQANIVDGFGQVKESYKISLQDLSDMIVGFKKTRESKQIVKTGDALTAKMYATYLSFLNTDDFKYDLKMNVDNRGSFTEFLKTNDYGQVSINISKPGIVKGNHWHHTKNEKFLVVSGKGVIRFRNIYSNEILEYFVSGEVLQVVDIPTGYTHNIENLGESDMVTVMWASEAFDPNKPDTYFLEV